MPTDLPTCIHALRNLAKIRQDLRGNLAGIEDVDKVIDAVVREMVALP